MFFSSGGEFILVVAFLVLQLLLRSKTSNALQKGLLLLGNLVLISTLINYATVAMHLVLATGIFYLGQAASQPRNSWRRKGIITGITLLIFLFIFRNYPKLFGISGYYLTTDPASLIERLGISYILFRHIQFLVDAFKGRIAAFNLVDYINFILFFPTLIAGPIDRYVNFKRWSDRLHGRIKSALILPGVGRIFIGFVKKYGLVPLIYDWSVSYEPFAETMDYPVAIMLSLLCYSAYILLDFSGYSDIAIGTGYILGYRTPENFRSPYLATNIADFWRRWHMTFSNFLRELIFKPIVKGIAKIGLNLPRIWVSIIGYLLTFAICGVWHGSTFNFIIWGLWHGAGLSAYKVWSLSRWHNQWHAWMERNGLTWLDKFLAMAITFIFVTIGWMFFHYKNNALLKVVERLLS